MSVTGAAVPYVFSAALSSATQGHRTGFGRFVPRFECSQFAVCSASNMRPMIRTSYP